MAVSGASRGGAITNKTTRKRRAMQVNVVVRVRPSLLHEKQQPVALTIAKSGHHSKGKGSLLTMQQPHGDEASEFLFEKCYDDATPQRILFQREIQPAIAKVLDGINTTVFAYGATGTGKTFTMEGSKRNLGMIPRSVKRLFEVAAEQKKMFQIDLSYLEIYNDRVLDLLVNKSQQQDLPIRQQTDGTIAVQGLTRKRITSLQEFEELYEKGSASRARAPTDMNPESSRSHSILMLQAQSTGAKGHEEIKYGKLHLIDLAGSEDNRRTGNSGARLQESGKINMSLFVLGKVITALNSGDLQRIPFRDSKLTRLLQDSLGGSSHAVMICNVAQSAGMYTECLQTLNYAAKAKGIVNQVVVNPPAAAATKTSTKKATAATAKTTAPATLVVAKTDRSKKTPVVGATLKPPASTATAKPSAAACRLQRAAPAAKPLGVAIPRKPPSLTPSISSLETKLSAWRQSKQEKRTSTESASSSSSFSTPTAAVGMKRSSPTALPSSTSSAASVRKLTSRMSLATTNSALRVPVPKKPRLSVMPTTTTTPTASSSSSSTISRKLICPNPAAKRSAVGSPAGDKENVASPNTIYKPTVASAVNLVKDLTPVDLAKKLIGVAIDLEKKKQFTAAYSVFKRAYHVLPEENPKLVERLHALEAQAPSAPSLVPCQQMSTAVYMQLVLEINLLEILNRGSQQELTKLHSIGDKRAEKIVETRPFSQLSDLLQVPGITEKLLQKLHDHHIQW